MKLREVLTMRECRWVTTHLSQYLDRDPAVPLSAEEVSRLTIHIEICEKCASISSIFTETTHALKQFRNKNDEESIVRLTQSLKKLTNPEVK